MSNQIIQLNEGVIKEELKDLVRKSVEETLNELLDKEAETLTCMNFPSEHWTKIRTTSTIERMNREIKRRTKVVGTFPDGNSALMLVCARLRYAAGTQWGSKRYLNMKRLEFMDMQIPETEVI